MCTFILSAFLSACLCKHSCRTESCLFALRAKGLNLIFTTGSEGTGRGMCTLPHRSLIPSWCVRGQLRIRVFADYFRENGDKNSLLMWQQTHKLYVHEEVNLSRCVVATGKDAYCSLSICAYQACTCRNAQYKRDKELVRVVFSRAAP